MELGVVSLRGRSVILVRYPKTRVAMWARVVDAASTRAQMEADGDVGRGFDQAACTMRWSTTGDDWAGSGYSAPGLPPPAVTIDAVDRLNQVTEWLLTATRNDHRAHQIMLALALQTKIKDIERAAKLKSSQIYRIKEATLDAMIEAAKK